MINYQQIDLLYGAPLNAISKPQVPFKLNAWHVIGAVLIGYVLYKAIGSLTPKVTFVEKSDEVNN